MADSRPMALVGPPNSVLGGRRRRVLQPQSQGVGAQATNGVATKRVSAPPSVRWAHGTAYVFLEYQGARYLPGRPG